jgi:hypothetical protein
MEFGAESGADAVDIQWVLLQREYADNKYILKTTEDNAKRLLFVQYPPKRLLTEVR